MKWLKRKIGEADNRLLFFKIVQLALAIGIFGGVFLLDHRLNEHGCRVMVETSELMRP